MLCLRPELTAVGSFEFALRERVARLTAFRHPCYAHVRGVERGVGFPRGRDPGAARADGLFHAAERRVGVDREILWDPERSPLIPTFAERVQRQQRPDHEQPSRHAGDDDEFPLDASAPSLIGRNRARRLDW